MIKRNVIPLMTICLVLLAAGCATVPEETPVEEESDLTYEERAAYKTTPEYIEAESYLNQMRDDTTIYFGEGIVEIGGDIAEARKNARRAALEELSGQIEIAVRSDMELIIAGRSTVGKGEVSDEVREIINARTETYTSQVLNNVQGNKQFIDYPMPGYVTFFVYIDKAEYEEKVKKDLQAKRNMVREMIRAGDREMVNNSFNAALRNWLEAKNNLIVFFGSLPVEGDIDGDGINEEFSACLQERVGRMMGNMRMTVSDGEFLYDSSGRLNMFPVIYLNYRTPEDRDVPVANFPVKVSFIEGYGRVPGNLRTGAYGQLELALEDIDSSRKITRLAVEVDGSAFDGLRNFSIPLLPSVELSCHKLKTVAVSFGFSNAGSVSSPREMKGAITSKVLGKDLSVTEASITRRTPTESDFQTVQRLNADYLILVFLETAAAETVGGYDNMFNINAGGVVSVYSMPLGEMIFSEVVPPQKGFGTSADNAGWDAYGRMKKNVLALVSAALDSIE